MPCRDDRAKEGKLKDERYEDKHREEMDMQRDELQQKVIIPVEGLIINNLEMKKTMKKLNKRD